MKAIIVCGGRDFEDKDLLFKSIKEINPDLIIHGCARGADSLAGEIAKELNIPIKEFPADWNKFGKSAGYKRNKQMLDYLLSISQKYDIAVLAMPGGVGTAMMVKISNENSVEVIQK